MLHHDYIENLSMTFAKHWKLSNNCRMNRLRYCVGICHRCELIPDLFTDVCTQYTSKWTQTSDKYLESNQLCCIIVNLFSILELLFFIFVWLDPEWTCNNRACTKSAINSIRPMTKWTNIIHHHQRRKQICTMTAHCFGVHRRCRRQQPTNIVCPPPPNPISTSGNWSNSIRWTLNLPCGKWST